MSGDGYNYGSTSLGDGRYSGFGNGSDGGRYTSDNQFRNMYDQTNMNLSFLSGRDGMDYRNPYAGLDYQGNGITNAYDKGTGFAGQGGVMGGYGVEGPNMDDIYANYGNMDYPSAGYIDPTTGARSTYQDILSKYEDAINSNNAALAATYKYQLEQSNQQYDETQKENYLNYMLAKKNLPAVLQSQGINGGMAESTRSALESEYMGNYNNTENARLANSTQINLASQQALSANNMQAAEIYAGIAQSMLEYEQTAAYYKNQYNLCHNVK